MPRKALNTSFGFNYDGTGTGQSGAPIETSATKINDTLVELDKQSVSCPLVPNGPSRVHIVPPAAKTIAGIKAGRGTAFATGTFTLTVKDADGNTLLSVASIDATTLTRALAAQTLTATVANLDIAEGEPIEIALTSNNVGATGGPAVVQITWAATAAPS